MTRHSDDARNLARQAAQLAHLQGRVEVTRHTLDGDDARNLARQAAQLAHLPYNEHWNGVEIYNGEDRLIVVVAMITNWRVLECPPGREYFYARAWCYEDDVTAAITAAQRWVLSGVDEPDGWVKTVHDGRRREDASN